MVFQMNVLISTISVRLNSFGAPTHSSLKKYCFKNLPNQNLAPYAYSQYN